MSKSEKKWGRVADYRIRHTWRCPNCKEEATVGPGFYEEAGTPVCGECDTDMEYLRTEVREK